jgi:tRNA A-37 threonylcarbamoyl transferase component Bud32
MDFRGLSHRTIAAHETQYIPPVSICELFDGVDIAEGIGSASSKGLVFRVIDASFQDGVAALKVMPDVEVSKSEIILAVYLSEFVKKNPLLPYFPVVFGSGECDSHLPEFDRDDEDNNNYERGLVAGSMRIDYIKALMIKHIEATQSVENEKVIDIGQVKAASNDDIMSWARALEVHIPETTRIRVLASELLYGDLSAVSFNDDIWKAILIQIPDAIMALHRLGIVHDDLHSGNVLLRKTGTTLTPVIHDFGESKYTSRLYYRRRDWLNLFVFSLPYGNMSKALKEKIKQMGEEIKDLLDKTTEEKYFETCASIKAVLIERL